MIPRSPVRGTHVDLPLGIRVDPSVNNATASECERVRTIPVDDSQFKLTIERRGFDWLPHDNQIVVRQNIPP